MTKMNGFSIEEILSKKTNELYHDRARHLTCSIPYNGSTLADKEETICLQKKHYLNEKSFSFRSTKPYMRHDKPYYCYSERRSPIYYSRCCRSSVSPPRQTSLNTSYKQSNIACDDDKVTRRPRTSITLYQRDFLEEEFQKERYPTLVYIDKLSRKIFLPQYVIKVWFQNRRAKYRKEGHRRRNFSETNNEIIHKSRDNNDNEVGESYDTIEKIHLSCDNNKRLPYVWGEHEDDNDIGGQQECSCLKCREGTSYVRY